MTEGATLITSRDGTRINVIDTGPRHAPAIVFAHALGMNLTLWDDVVAHLTSGLRVVRFDLRGHGASDTPKGPYSMGQLVSDAEDLCDALALQETMFLGLSVGGMIAQGLAVKRPDLIRALILSNTAAKIGTGKLWQDRIDAIKAHGMAAATDAVMKRWFGRTLYGVADITRWEAQFTATPIEGYTGVCAAIAGTDFYTPTSGLRIPTLGIAGADDTSIPPDLLRETVDLIPGAQFVLMRRTGHLPPAEHPVAFAKHINDFIAATGHLLDDRPHTLA